ncbi:MAG TPA: ABC transporter permease [Bryobacteraceae bacterium]|nr:ABC transporter permease [Bryobacteraceae bacterium]
MKDLSLALRQLSRAPGFTLTAVLVLALGVGANTSIFSFVSAFLLRPLPIDKPDETVLISGVEGATISYSDYLHWREQTSVFRGVAAFLPYGLDVIDENGRQRVFAELVSENYFKVLGVSPTLGRTPATNDSDRVAVVSREFWRRHLHASIDLAQQTININHRIFAVIGVMPERFTGLASPWRTDLWIPFRAQGQILPRAPRDFREAGALITARVQPGITIQQVHAAVGVLEERLHRDTGAPPQKVTIQKGGGLTWQPLIPIAVLLSAVVGLILLIACGNLASLLAVRTSSRRREIAVRLALGASRGRLVRMLVTESTVLSVLGAVASLLLVRWTGDFLSSLIPETISGGFAIDHRLDWRVLSFTLALSVSSVTLFGLRPALAASKPDLAPALKGEGASCLYGSRIRGLFLIAQIASSTVVLIVAGLFISSLVRLETLSLGFDTSKLLIVELSSSEGLLSGADRSEYYHRLRNSVQSLPGVRSVSLLSGIPMGIENDTVEMRVTGQGPIQTFRSDVDALYFSTIGHPLLRGRDFRRGDVKVVIINETLARRAFAGQDPIGKRIQLDRPGSTYEIVGVVGDIRYSPLRETPQPYVYLPSEQVQTQSAFLLVSTTQGPTGVASLIGREIRAHAQTADDYLRPVLEPARSAATLMTILGALALALAAFGLYGVTAYSTAQRTTEVGIRVALGASTSRMLRLVLGEALLFASIGTAIGFVVSLGIAQAVSSFLYGLSAVDPYSFLGATAVLIGSVVTAAFLPAVRAVRIDPATVLRHE